MFVEQLLFTGTRNTTNSYEGRKQNAYNTLYLQHRILTEEMSNQDKWYLEKECEVRRQNKQDPVYQMT